MFKQYQVIDNFFFQQHYFVEMYEHTKFDELYHEKHNNFEEHVAYIPKALSDRKILNE